MKHSIASFYDVWSLIQILILKIAVLHRLHSLLTRINRNRQSNQNKSGKIWMEKLKRKRQLSEKPKNQNCSPFPPFYRLNNADSFFPTHFILTNEYLSKSVQVAFGGCFNFLLISKIYCAFLFINLFSFEIAIEHVLHATSFHTRLNSTYANSSR